MGKIIITMEVGDEYADEDDSTGLTEEGFDRLNEGLAEIGYDIDVRKAK